MLKRKMIEVGARRLEKLLNNYIDNTDYDCEYCPAFRKCNAKMPTYTIAGVMIYRIGSVVKCKRNLKRWLTCQQ